MFNDIREIKIDDIINYCKEHKQTKWLKEIAATEGLTNKNGTVRKISFIEIRNAFCEKFMPELAPKHKGKKKSMYDLIDEL